MFVLLLVTFENVSDLLFEIIKLERREKAQTS